MSELAEIHAVLRELKEDVGEIRGDVKALRNTINERGTRLDKHEERIATLEISAAQSSGRVSVWSTLAGFLAGGVATFIAKHYS